MSQTKEGFVGDMCVPCLFSLCLYVCWQRGIEEGEEALKVFPAIISPPDEDGLPASMSVAFKMMKSLLAF